MHVRLQVSLHDGLAECITIGSSVCLGKCCSHWLLSFIFLCSILRFGHFGLDMRDVASLIRTKDYPTCL